MIGFQLLPKSRLDCSVIMEKTSYHVHGHHGFAV